eukprot:TRINITY_DN860_c0_g3_i1.p2 TRINITY_DN860_c0_g3~~TRINITY_DN860_c0_g3_i1.p2  ORF type:complete len:170 (+),score=50.04 TRINITY_DN860_c0_g3_i1:373-882(+)
MGEHHKSWKTRWFVLSCEKLWYYRKKDAAKPISFIELADTTVRTSNAETDEQFVFEIVTKGRIYMLAAREAEGMAQWMDDIAQLTVHNTENKIMVDAEKLIMQIEHSKCLQKEAKNLELSSEEQDDQSYSSSTSSSVFQDVEFVLPKTDQDSGEQSKGKFNVFKRKNKN